MTNPSVPEVTMSKSATDECAIVIVQGSFQTPLVYEKLADSLSARGYSVIHPQLPSCTDTEDPNFPTRTLADDASVVREELLRLIERDGKTVLVVMHSYGGLVGSEAIPEELCYSKRQARALPGGVIHLFYFCAFLLQEGQSVLSAFGESPNNDVRVSLPVSCPFVRSLLIRMKPDGRFYLSNGKDRLYNDLPEFEASLWASRLIAQSHLVQTTQITRAAWRYIPSTYLICKNDQVAPVQYQEMFAATAKAVVESCGASHSPMLSQPDFLADRIVNAFERAIAGEEGA